MRRSRTLLTEIETEILLIGFDKDAAAIGEFAKEDFARKRLFDLFVNEPRHRAGTVAGVKAMGGEPFAGIFGESYEDAFLGELAV